MKSLLLVLCLVLLTPMVSKAENWVYAGVTEFAARTVGVGSVSRVSSDIVTFSMKLDYIDKSRLDHSVGVVQFNCTTKQIMLVDLTVWDLNNQPQKLAVNPIWQETNDSPLIAKLNKIVCIRLY